jgi:hypothetical protein
MGAQLSEDEWRKQITSVLLSGEAVIIIDNVFEPLKAIALDTALTAENWSDRMLGRNEQVILPQRATWIATGNNLRLGGELPRRCYRIRLDARMERPWNREVGEFLHPHLSQWGRANRRAIVRALLILIRAWFSAACPAFKSPPLGGFEEWARLAGGILGHAGYENFLGGLEAMYEETGGESMEWACFLQAAHDVYGNELVTAAQLTKALQQRERFRNALPGALAEAYASDHVTFARLLGRALAKHADVRCQGGIYVRRAGTAHRTILWQIVQPSPEK